MTQAARPTGEELRELMQQVAQGTLSDLLGTRVLEADRGLVRARLEIDTHHLGPTGYVHAGTVVTLADTCAGMGCVASFPEGIRGFTTAELKLNFLRSATPGDALVCDATLTHSGRTTQVWDARVAREHDDRLLGLYRCTQILLPEVRDTRGRAWTGDDGGTDE